MPVGLFISAYARLMPALGKPGARSPNLAKLLTFETFLLVKCFVVVVVVVFSLLGEREPAGAAFK